MTTTKPIFLVAGARPNFMKIAPLIKELKKQNLNYKLIHTGQHYDYNMSKVFFDDLGIPEPDYHLGVGSGSHAEQTANIMIEFEKVVKKANPSLVIVVGDVNSTIACALVAKKLFVKVAHVEAGLRSFDMRMPEEINRILTDRISDYLFTTEKSGMENLKNEGINQGKIFFVGNIMIDTLFMNINKAEKTEHFTKVGLQKGKYALLTLHRPSNVDNRENLLEVLKIINYLKQKIQIFFPAHPRTIKNLKRFNLYHHLKEDENITLTEPVGYLEFLNLMSNSKIILTDSGGIQEEASVLNIPVLTLRENTERPITITQGTNLLIGRDFEKAKKQIDKILSGKFKKKTRIKNWDGHTAKRIVKIIKNELSL